jgi:hypothetical protein
VFHVGLLNREGITEAMTALLAIGIRAPAKVRAAAHELADSIVGPFGLDWQMWEYEDTPAPPDPETEAAIEEDRAAKRKAIEWAEAGDADLPWRGGAAEMSARQWCLRPGARSAPGESGATGGPGGRPAVGPEACRSCEETCNELLGALG